MGRVNTKMRDRIFLHIGAAFPEQLDWLRSTRVSAAQTERVTEVSGAASPNAAGSMDAVTITGDNHYTLSRGSLAEIARAASGCQIIVLVPGELVTLTRAVVPSRQRQHIINAVP
jgi:hypothetical protein